MEGYDGSVKPGGIPATRTPAHYISFHAALNLRIPDEETGGWPAHTALHVPIRSPDRLLPCAGDGERVNTNPALGAYGVRDMGDILRDLFRRTAAHTGGMDVRAGPIWVANHFRAIADLVAIDQTRPQ